MNKRVKKKWLEYLRSGAFKQTNGRLCKSKNGHDSFCCLGVLTQLYVDEHPGSGWMNKTELEGPQREIFSDVMDGSLFFEDGNILCGMRDESRPNYESEELPKVVRDWAGLKDVNPNILIPDPYNEDDTSSEPIAELNDKGKSFEELADLIEKQL